MNTVLVTGASGFLGDYIVNSLVRKRANTICASRNPSKSQKVRNERIDLSKSILDFSGLDVRTVIHNAGLAHDVSDSFYEPHDYFDTNVTGTNNLLSGLNGSLQTLKQFIFISTVAVYGLSSGSDIEESSSLDGESPYAKSKIEAEEILIKWCEKNDIDLLILRLPLVIGRNPKGNLQRLQRMANKRAQLRIFHDKSSKSIVHAEDVADLVSSDIPMNGVFNLTDGRKYTFNEIYDFLSSSNARLSAKVPIPSMLMSLLGKLGNAANYMGFNFPLNSISVSKIQSELTFSSAKAFEQLKWKPKPALRDC